MGIALVCALVAWGVVCSLMLVQRRGEEARLRGEVLAAGEALRDRLVARNRGIERVLGDLPVQWGGRVPPRRDFDLAARTLSRLYPEVRGVFLLDRTRPLLALDPDRGGRRPGNHPWQVPSAKAALAGADLRTFRGSLGPLDLPGGQRVLLVLAPLDRAFRGASGPLVAVVSLQGFLEAPEVAVLPGRLELALQDARSGRVFHGDPLTLARRPVRVFVPLTPGGWNLSTLPLGGWKSLGSPSRRWGMAAGGMAAGGALLGYLGGRRLMGRLRRRRERSVREGHYRDLVESVHDLIWEVDAQGVFTFLGPQVEGLLGMKPEELVGRTPFSLMPHKEGVRMQKLFRIRAAKGEDFLWEESAWIGRDALVYWETNARPFFREDGSLGGYRGVNRDVTDRKLREAELDGQVEELDEKMEELRRSASLDPLTEALNRRSIERELMAETRRADRYGNPLTVILCDIDRFKSINDRYGHQEGDCALRAFSRIVRGCLRTGDHFGRWGGEEFLVVAPVDGPGGAALAEKLRLELETVTRATPVPFTASFGVAVYVPGEPPETLVQRADEAMYRAKESGRNRVEVA